MFIPPRFPNERLRTPTRSTATQLKLWAETTSLVGTWEFPEQDQQHVAGLARDTVPTGPRRIAPGFNLGNSFKTHHKSRRDDGASLVRAVVPSGLNALGVCLVPQVETWG